MMVSVAQPDLKLALIDLAGGCKLMQALQLLDRLSQIPGNDGPIETFSPRLQVISSQIVER